MHIRHVSVLCLLLITSCTCKIKVRSGPDTTPLPSTDMGTPWQPLNKVGSVLTPISATSNGDLVLVGAVARTPFRNVLLRSKDNGRSWEYKMFYGDSSTTYVANDAQSAIAATATTLVSSDTNRWSLLNRPAMGRAASPITGVATFAGQPEIAVTAAQPCPSAPDQLCAAMYRFDGRSWNQVRTATTISLLVGHNGAYAGVSVDRRAFEPTVLFHQAPGQAKPSEVAFEDLESRRIGALGEHLFVVWNQTSKRLEFYRDDLTPLGFSSCADLPFPITVLADQSVLYAHGKDLYHVTTNSGPQKVYSANGAPRGAVVARNEVLVLGVDATGFWVAAADQSLTHWQVVYHQ